MTLEELILRADELDTIASRIQVDQQAGLSDQDIRAFVDAYQSWFAECISLLPPDLEEKFRAEYKGTWYASKIERFLQAPLKLNVLYQPDETGKLVIPYWLYSYDTAFHAPLLAQRQILWEAVKRERIRSRNLDVQASLTSGRPSSQDLRMSLYDCLTSDLVSLEEIEDICFRLGAHWDRLSGDTQGRKVRSLIDRCDRQRQLDELRKMIVVVRPDLADRLN